MSRFFEERCKAHGTLLVNSDDQFVGECEMCEVERDLDQIIDEDRKWEAELEQLDEARAIWHLQFSEEK